MWLKKDGENDLLDRDRASLILIHAVSQWGSAFLYGLLE